MRKPLGIKLGRIACLLALLLSACDDAGEGVRRPTPAAASGEIVTVSIGPAGGSITSSDGKLRLDVPAGALGSTQDISVRVIAPGDADAALQAFSPMRAYRMLPDGLTFAVPALVTLTLERQPTVTDTGNERRIDFTGPLALLQASRGMVNAVATRNDVSSDGSEQFTASIEHFSDLALVSGGGAEEGDASRHFTTSTYTAPRTLAVGATGDIVIELTLKPTRRFSTSTATVSANGTHPALETPGVPRGGVDALLVPDLVRDIRLRLNVRCTAAGTFTLKLEVRLPSIDNTRGDRLSMFPSASLSAPITCTAGPNRAPMANADSYRTPRNTTLTLAAPGFLGNDTDPDGDALTATSGTRTSHGTLDANVAGGFVYAPDAGFTGTDTFTYTAADGRGGETTGTVTIEVFRDNSPPVGAADRYGTTRNTALAVAAPGVLENDSDADDGPVRRAMLQAGPVHGALTRRLETIEGDETNLLAWTGGFDYAPDSGFVGVDSFSYTPVDSDGTEGEAIEVLIDVTAPISNASAQLIALGGGTVPFSPEAILFLPQTVERPFPIPGASSDRMPLLVAGRAPTVQRANDGAITASALVAADAATGDVLYLYDVGATLFDALPLQGDVEAGGNVDRLIGLSGLDGESTLFIFDNGTEGGRALSGRAGSGFDVSYLVGAAPLSGYVVTLANGNGVFVRRYRQDPFGSSTFGLFTEPRLFDGTVVGTRPTNVRSTVANADGTRFLVAGVSSTGEGQLHQVLRSVRGGNQVTDTITTVGTLGPNPRRMRCGALPAPRTDFLCAVSDFTSNSLTLFTWDGESAPVLGPEIPVGDGPVGIDVFDGMVLSAGYDDDTFTLIRTQPGNPLGASPTVTTRRVADIPAIAACDAPGHAIFLRDEDHRIALSCNLSSQVAVLPDAY